MNRPSTSSRLNPNVICVRSLVPNEKNSADVGDAIRDQRGARRLDHRADEVVQVVDLRGSASTASASSRTHPSSSFSSGSLTISGIMISTIGLPPACLRVTAACISARTCMR